MNVTLIINNVVYIVDDLDMLQALVERTVPAMTPQEESDFKGMNESSQAPLRILFVEDNDYVRDLTLCLLEDGGREVTAFASAEEALSAFQSSPFDVVITDVSLPGISGIEFARRVLKIAPDTWCVIASGYQMPADLNQLGARVRSMTKPFESEQIDALLTEVRNARPARARAQLQ